MDTQLVDLKHLGLCGIYREACKLIFSFKMIFFHITLALILPLTLFILAETPFSYLIFGQIRNNEWIILQSVYGNSKDNPIRKASTQQALSQLFKTAYSLFFLLFSLLCVTAVVYTVTCIYTAKPFTFKNVMRVVPKLWKRLLVTFFWYFLISVILDVVWNVVLTICYLSLGNKSVGSVVIIIMTILYLALSLYINVIWLLASMMSVLENVYGRKALRKSQTLIWGKMFLACFILVTINILYAVVYSLFDELVVNGNFLIVLVRVIVGIVCFLVVLIASLYGLVLQTVIYFVCKAYHEEIIDKTSLADYVEGYMGEYARLREPPV